MKKDPMVIITNAMSRSDYSGAKAFGELHVLSDKIYSFIPESPANAVLRRDIAAAAAMFDPATDHILPSGSSISTALFLLALFARGIRTVRVLMWRGNDQSYQSGMLDLSVALGG